MLNNQQAQQTLQQMRSIVNQLSQQEQQNAGQARKLADMEASNELTLRGQNAANPQGMAQREGQAASQLRNLASAEQNATQQLSQLNQLMSQLEGQLRQ